MGDVPKCGFMERDGLRVPGGVVHYYQKVLMATGGIWEWCYQFHTTRPLERNPDDR